MSLSRSPCLPAIAVACVLSAAAHAAPEDPAVFDDGVKDLASVNVTANKVEQTLLEVPASISVIDAAELDERGIQSITDVMREIPNLIPVSGTSGHDGVNIRGLNTSAFTNANPVVIYIDGIAQSNRYGFAASLANVEQVEVLRGPQGTLYGKDAIGGVIHIVTRRPDNAPAGRVGAEYGTDNTWFSTFNLNGALKADTLWWGVSGQMSGEDGWISNTWPNARGNADPRRERHFNAFMLYEPGELFSARLSLNTEASTIHWVHAMAAPGGTPLSAFSRAAGKRARFDVDTKDQSDGDSVALALNWALPGVAVESVSTYRKYQLDGIYDADFAAEPVYLGLTQFNATTSKTLAQELRASSRHRDGVRWVAGVYLENETFEQGPYGMEFPNFDPMTGDFFGNFAMNVESVADTRTRAAFGQVMLPFAGQWELTLGGRWQRIEKEIDLNTWFVSAGGDRRAGPPMYTLNARKTWTAFLPKAALNWRFHPQWAAHLSFAEGYMPGGFNYFAAGGTAEDNRFEPQTSRNLETGIKGGIGAFMLGVDVFYMQIEDIHIYKSNGAIYTTGNARKAHSRGIELEAAWRPAQTHLEVNAALGVARAKYDDYDTGMERFDGKPIENTPRHTLRVGAAWNPPQGVYARLDARGQGAQYFYDDAARGFPRSGGHTVLDARLGWRGGAWEVYASVRNLTDREYVTGFLSSAAVALANFGDPRRYSVGVRYGF